MNCKSPSLRRVTASVCFVLTCALLPVSACHAAIANAWHIPDDSSNLGGTHMRDPEFEINQNTAVTFYTGLQKFGNAFGTANQTGGTLFFKKQSATTWSSAALSFNSDSGNNQYWKATCTFSAANGYTADDVIQYYFALAFDGSADTTYIYGGNGDYDGPAANRVTASQATAAATPFTIRNRAAYVYHANNRVVNGTSVTFTTKVGYIGKSGTTASQYVDRGALYYTTNGTAPAGALGVASGNTVAVPLTLGYTENDSSIAGNAMDWVGTVNGLPMNTTIKYKVSFWNSANNEEKFADYNTSGTNGATFSFSIGAVGDPVLTVNGVTANYTTTHVFANEVAGDQIPLAVFFDPGTAAADPATIQVYTNLNRRDYATLGYTDSFGLATQEGIEPPSGDVVGANDLHYYKAYAMTAAAGGGYATTLYGSKTGAYRLTARYKLTSGSSPNPNPWVYYTSNGRRDHAIVVSPVTSRDIRLYELNTLNIDATGQLASQRSTFADLHDSTKRWNLTYLSNLGCNWLWFQPIHPDGIDGRQDYPNTTTPYNVGSPYAVKNFFEIMPLMARSFTGASDTSPTANDPNPVAPTDPAYAASPRGKARTEFHDFVVDADTANVGVMLDAPFNHTSFDAEFGLNGIPLFAPTSSAGYTGVIENAEARVYSNTSNYALRASGASTVAVAPDRTDFGKFNDVHDIYFGTYSALVDTASDSGNYNNEGDQFYGYLGNGAFPNGNPEWNAVDFSVSGVNSNITRNVWRYFAAYVPYWLGQTGHVDGNGNLIGNSTNPNAAQRLAEDSRGIDGLRADFGQGLPPQCWEYVINVARSYKWNFVFMTESLDGGAVTYRSNRHFDILNENIVFSFQNASTAQNYRDLFDNRRSAYGQSLVLMNSTSHDEAQYTDPYQALIRYMVAGTIDGVPMVFYGQENGISTAYDSSNNPYVFGFDHTELNFGKAIVNFKQFNSLGPVLASANRTFALDQLYPDFAAVGQARGFSPALRSSNRYYLNQADNSIQQNIFSVAKYATANAYPGVSDVVFGFVNLDRNNVQRGAYNVNITQNGSNLFGIQRGRTYNVRNISAYLGQDSTRRGTYLIPGNITGDALLDGGFYVSLNPVPTSDAGWTSAPFEAQYLKLYDLTPPPAGTVPSSAKGYGLGSSATFNWSAVSDPVGGVSGYRLIVSTDAAGQNVVFNGLVGNVTNYTVTGVAPGQMLYARIAAVNSAGVQGPLSAASTATPVLDPSADSDGDGQSNAAEDLAGTNPLDATSLLRVTGVVRNSPAATTQITWTSVAGKQYQVEATDNLSGGAYTAVSGVLTATGVTMSFTDASSAGNAFYRVKIVR